MSSPAQRAAQAARSALNQAMRDSVDTRRFRIDRFGRHRDGYLHARVIVDGTRPVYFHCRFGSWLAPGSSADGRSFLKEPEALLGRDLGRVLKFALSDQAMRFHPNREEPNGPAESTEDTGSDDPAVPADGVPA